MDKLSVSKIEEGWVDDWGGGAVRFAGVSALANITPLFFSTPISCVSIDAMIENIVANILYTNANIFCFI